VAALKRKIDETKRVLAEERARKEEARKLEEARQLEEARIKHENKTRELETANKRWFIVVLVGTTVALLLDIYWR
jgi:septal ring factor EnvC (AmiA/AmiB activator)